MFDQHVNVTKIKVHNIYTRGGGAVFSVYTLNQITIEYVHFSKIVSVL